MPDIEISLSKYAPITKVIIDNDYIFNFATNYYYNNTVTDLKSFKLKDSDFNNFKTHLKSNNFAFQTKTEKALDNVKQLAFEEGLINDLSKEYNALVNKLNSIKNKAVTANKEQLLTLLENEIVTRYFYREGMYEYFLINNIEVKKAIEILGNFNTYNSFLN